MGWIDLTPYRESKHYHTQDLRLTQRQVGNAAEHFTAVSVSVKDKLDLSISVAVSILSFHRISTFAEN